MEQSSMLFQKDGKNYLQLDCENAKDYIISKCKYDANFVVRMVCAEVEKGANKE